jgi:hypothetical protein
MPFPIALVGAFVLAAPPQDPPVTSANPILFVTQVPIVSDYLTVASTFGNHDASPRSVPRGGALWIRYPDGVLRNLTAAAGLGAPAGFQGEDSIAVREPSVHWSGTKAVFSMVVGAPETPSEGHQRWQLYEITGFARGATPVITRVPGQPPVRNNVSPCYASDGRILFASDRPRDGSPHLFPQLDEYEEAPTNTGLWSLDPASGELYLMQHAPSGSFKPSVDRSGRVVFTRWDHLERDQQADLDRMGLGNYRVFNWSDEGPNAVRTGSNAEVFPEPRAQWIDYVNSTPSYDGPLAGWRPYLAGLHFNHFLPWTLNQDGTGEETLGHLGRHELFRTVPRSRIDDPNVAGQSSFPPAVANTRPLTAFHQLREDPLVPGSYWGIDCREFDVHASGQIVRIAARPFLNTNEIVVHHMTHPDTQAPTLTPGPNHSGFYRNPLPLSDGQEIAVHTANTKKDQNLGTATAPRSRFDFRLKELVPGPSGHLVAGRALTPGLAKRVQYYDPYRLVTYDGLLWELDPVEVVARPVPPLTSETPLDPPERGAFALAGVTVPALRSWLERNELALIVTRNATRRDRNDRQQPFNLRVPGGVRTLSAPGRIYDVAYLRVLQGDLIRGIENGVASSAGGRRVLAQPLHEPAADNPPSAGPPGTVALGSDGSLAALVPARRALSWQLLDPSGVPVVNERYWITLQPGEIRTCTGCHGQNELDQAGQAPPTNVPEALRTLLEHLEAQGHL